MQVTFVDAPTMDRLHVSTRSSNKAWTLGGMIVKKAREEISAGSSKGRSYLGLLNDMK